MRVEKFYLFILCSGPYTANRTQCVSVSCKCHSGRMPECVIPLIASITLEIHMDNNRVGPWRRRKGHTKGVTREGQSRGLPQRGVQAFLLNACLSNDFQLIVTYLFRTGDMYGAFPHHNWWAWQSSEGKPCTISVSWMAILCCVITKTYSKDHHVQSNGR